MYKSFLRRGLPLLLGLSFFVAAPPARAEDEARQMETQYGVLSRDTYEGQKFNDQLDRVVPRIVAAVQQNNPDTKFRLASAKILGGRTEKGDKVVNAFALPDGHIYVTVGN